MKKLANIAKQYCNNIVNNWEDVKSFLTSSFAPYIKLTLNQHFFGDFVKDFLQDIDLYVEDVKNYDDVAEAFINYLEEQKNIFLEQASPFVNQYLKLRLNIFNIKSESNFQQIIEFLTSEYKSVINSMFIIQQNELLNIVVNNLFSNNKSFSTAEVNDSFCVEGNFCYDLFRRKGCFAIIANHYLADETKIHSELTKELQQTYEECNGVVKNSFGYIVEQDNKLFALINLSRTEGYNWKEIINILKTKTFENQYFSGYFRVNESCTTMTGCQRIAKKHLIRNYYLF